MYQQDVQLKSPNEVTLKTFVWNQTETLLCLKVSSVCLVVPWQNRSFPKSRFIRNFYYRISC